MSLASRDGADLAHDALPYDVAHTLAPVQAVDLDGHPVRLGTLWEDAHAVLVFLRHFG
jgi:hypothetical protein